MSKSDLTGKKITAEKVRLDVIDRKILNILQENNQITNQALAEKVNITPPPCLRRVRRLHKEGIITHDVAILDQSKMLQGLFVHVSVRLEKERTELLENFERKMLEYDEIIQCFFLSGTIDYALLVYVDDMEHYDRFAREVFANDPSMKIYDSYFCLKRVKYTTKITLPEY